MDRKDIDELIGQRYSASSALDEMRRFNEERALQKQQLGLDRMVAPLSYISEAERRLLMGDAKSARERLLTGAGIESLKAPTHAEQAFVKMREMEKAALKHQSGLDLYISLEKETRAAREAIFASTKHAGLERNLFSADKEWERMLGSSDSMTRASMLNPAREAAAAYYASTKMLASRMHDEGLTAAHNTRYIERIFEPINYHARFTRETFDWLAKPHVAEREAAALRGSMTLFNDQITRLTAAVSTLITPQPTVLPPHSGRIYSPPGGFNLPATQQGELLEQEELPANVDYETLAPLAPSSEVADDTIACVILYERCNEAQLFNGKDRIFTPTTRGTVAACRIGMIVTDSREQFDTFIDQLYMLFYEGTGGQKIKLLKENGGVMDRPECEALWDIKQLRSKRSRHDIDHGSNKDVQKKYGELREMYQRLGVSRFPQTPDEYKLLQRAVLRNLRVFLTEVAERLEKDGGLAGSKDDE